MYFSPFIIIIYALIVWKIGIKTMSASLLALSMRIHAGFVPMAAWIGNTHTRLFFQPACQEPWNLPTANDGCLLCVREDIFCL